MMTLKYDAKIGPANCWRYEAWNATMLPDMNDIRSGPFGYADEVADHIGMQRKTPGGE